MPTRRNYMPQLHQSPIIQLNEIFNVVAVHSKSRKLVQATRWSSYSQLDQLHQCHYNAAHQVQLQQTEMSARHIDAPHICLTVFLPLVLTRCKPSQAKPRLTRLGSNTFPLTKCYYC